MYSSFLKILLIPNLKILKLHFMFLECPALSADELIIVNVTTEIEKDRLFSGTAVEFKCVNGYRMKNSTLSENICLPSGEWKVEFPSCVPG